MHENEWNIYVIQCNSYVEAAKYAAEHDWWLHAWTWLPDTTVHSTIKVYKRVEE